MKNLNPDFSGGMDKQNDLLAYIDESGDDGFKFDNGGTKWFVVSSLAGEYQSIQSLFNTIDEFRKKDSKNIRNFSQLSFKKLKHLSRKDVCWLLKKHQYNTVHSLFYKPDINPKDRICTYPSMYFVGIKNVLERLTWLCKHQKKNKAHLMISARNNIDMDALSKYLFKYSIVGQRNMMYLEKIGQVTVSTENNCPRLLLGDYTASAMRFAIEKTGQANLPEPCYFDLLLKGTLYSSTHPQFKGIWNNGIKCTPGNKDLLSDSGILEEGSHKSLELAADSKLGLH